MPKLKVTLIKNLIAFIISTLCFVFQVNAKFPKQVFWSSIGEKILPDLLRTFDQTAAHNPH